jgi:hypothetical protein
MPTYSIHDKPHHLCISVCWQGFDEGVSGQINVPFDMLEYISRIQTVGGYVAVKCTNEWGFGGNGSMVQCGSSNLIILLPI